jgi:hypothetical protein
MKIIVFLIAYALALTTVVFADQALIPDTTLPYPVTDHACDDAMTNEEFTLALPSCLKSAKDYAVLVTGATDGDARDRLEFYQMRRKAPAFMPGDKSRPAEGGKPRLVV